MSNTTAVAIFTKTPGWSVESSELKQAIGQRNFEVLQSLTIKSVDSVVRAAIAQDSRLKPYWIVTDENKDDIQLTSFQKIVAKKNDSVQGVYDQLLKEHENVILLSTQVPQLTPSQILKADLLLFDNPVKNPKVVIGRTETNGIYLFAGSHPIQFPNSSSAIQWEKTFASKTIIHHLEYLFSVTDSSNLTRLGGELAYEVTLSPSQQKLIKWINQEGR